MKVEMSRWEGDEFIIEIDGRPIGSTLTFERAKIIEEWLQSNSSKLTLLTENPSRTELSSEGTAQLLSKSDPCAKGGKK